MRHGSKPYPVNYTSKLVSLVIKFEPSIIRVNKNYSNLRIRFKRFNQNTTASPVKHTIICISINIYFNLILHVLHCNTSLQKLAVSDLYSIDSLLPRAVAYSCRIASFPCEISINTHYYRQIH